MVMMMSGAMGVAVGMRVLTLRQVQVRPSVVWDVDSSMSMRNRRQLTGEVPQEGKAGNHTLHEEPNWPNVLSGTLFLHDLKGNIGKFVQVSPS